MLTVTVRTIIMYLTTIAAMRLMGKRQIGELKPSELVTTILISNLASLPIEDTQISFFMGITPIVLIAAIEIILSVIEVKSTKLSDILTGSDKILIKDGKINQKMLRSLRYTVSDLISALRGKNAYDLKQIKFAVIETDGTINIFKTSEDAKHLMTPLVMDGDYYIPGMRYRDMSESDVDQMLMETGHTLKETALLQINEQNEKYVLKSEFE